MWDRVFGYYDHVMTRYPNTWDNDDTDAQIAKIQDLIIRFPMVSVWSRVPMYRPWRERGFRETWEKGCPWHMAYTRETEDDDNIVYCIFEAEHEEVLATMA